MTLEEPKVNKQILLRDDFIEFILKKTKNDTEFRVYEGKWGILVGIDKEVKNVET